MSLKLITVIGLIVIGLATCNTQLKAPNSNTTQGTSNSRSETLTTAEVEPQLIVDPAPPQNPMAAAEQNFKTYCSGCHGTNANVFVDRKWEHGNDRPSLIKSMRSGIIQEGMPAFDTTFTSSELEEMADYILKAVAQRSSYTTETQRTPKYTEENDYTLVIDTVATDAEIPWGIKVDKQGTLYYTDRKGDLYIKTNGSDATKIGGVPKVWEYGQGGLLDVALHPQFSDTQILYLTYSRQQPGTDLGTTVLVSGVLKGNQLTSVKQLFEALPYVDTRYHFGSRVVFDNSGYLYVSVGDRGKRDDHPQYLTNDCGKIHRLHLDGTIPDDNPFKDDDGKPLSIWSYGHRNPQGLIYDPETNTVWDNEHGPRGGDELNLIEKGKNFGWPLVSYGINYNGTTFTDLTTQEGMVDAKTTWVPSIAPSGMAIIDSPVFSKWKGDILTGSLRFDYISRVKIENNTVVEEERILEGIGRVRSVEMGRDGYIYVGVEEPGRILRVSVNQD